MKPMLSKASIFDFLVRVRVPNRRLRILEPLGEDTPIGKFLNKRGPGIQQLAFEVDELEETIRRLMGEGIRMIHETPVDGAHGTKIAFVHPSSTGGVLVELVEYVTH